MKLTFYKSIAVKRIALVGLALFVVAAGTLAQDKILKVDAAVQVLLVSRTAIPFGTVFPGEMLNQNYTVQLDTSHNAATYITTLDPVVGQQNLCPFLTLTNIDSPAEPDILPNSTLTRPGDVVDKWQVKLTVPGIKGQLSQDHDGGIIVQGGDFACKITITTQTHGKIIICKQSLGDTGNFAFTGALGPFSIQTQGSGSNGNESLVQNHNQSGDDHSGDDDHNKFKCDQKSDDNKDKSDDNSRGKKNGSGSKTFDNLDAGIYNVTETVPGSWDLTSIICVDPTHNTTVAKPIATIKLDDSETVICTFTNTKKPKGSISGMKFEDKNGNHKKDYGEGGLKNWTIKLTKPDFSIQTTTTDSSGNYVFTNLPPGIYKVMEIQQNGWDQTTPLNPNFYTITLGAGQNVTHKDFGNKKKPDKHGHGY